MGTLRTLQLHVVASLAKDLNSYIKMADAFVGKFIIDRRENYDGFMKGVGVPDEYIEKGRDAKVTTEIAQNGDSFVITRIRPAGTTSNTLTLGKESELDTIKGDKIKVTVTFAGGVLTAKGEKYEMVMSLKGNSLKESLTVNGHTMTRYSTRQ